MEEGDEVGVQCRRLVLPDAPHEVPELRGGGQLLSVYIFVYVCTIRQFEIWSGRPIQPPARCAVLTPKAY